MCLRRGVGCSLVDWLVDGSEECKKQRRSKRDGGGPSKKKKEKR